MKLGAIETSTFSELELYENHRDPFDRMIIWQSIVNDMVLISKDKEFKLHDDPAKIKKGVVNQPLLQSS